MDNTDILTLILLNLDLPTLLRVQRVSKDWHHLIQSTSSLQQILHLSLSRNISKYPLENQLLVQYFPDFYPFPFSERYTGRPGNAGTPEWCPFEEPFPSHPYPTHPQTLLDWFLGRTRHFSWKEARALPLPPLQERHAAWMREGASWRDMLTHQPPITRLEVLYESQGQFAGFSYAIGALDLPDGLRMGTLYDFISGSWSESDITHQSFEVSVERLMHPEIVAEEHEDEDEGLADGDDEQDAELRELEEEWDGVELGAVGDSDPAVMAVIERFGAAEMPGWCMRIRMCCSVTCCAETDRHWGRSLGVRAARSEGYTPVRLEHVSVRTTPDLDALGKRLGYRLSPRHF